MYVSEGSGPSYTHFNNSNKGPVNVFKVDIDYDLPVRCTNKGVSSLTCSSIKGRYTKIS